MTGLSRTRVIAGTALVAMVLAVQVWLYWPVVPQNFAFETTEGWNFPLWTVAASALAWGVAMVPFRLPLLGAIIGASLHLTFRVLFLILLVSHTR